MCFHAADRHLRPFNGPAEELQECLLYRDAAVVRGRFGRSGVSGLKQADAEALFRALLLRTHMRWHTFIVDLEDTSGWIERAIEALADVRASAAASRLVEMLLAGHQDLRLDAESLDRIITWIDLNVPYYDNTAVTRPGSMYGKEERSGRAVVRNAKPLWDALPGRCWDCHGIPGAPRKRQDRQAASGRPEPRSFRMAPVEGELQFLELPKTMTRPCVNLTHPDESRVLTAPLATAAGGLGLCGEAVFPDRKDPTYQAALKVIQSWHEDLVARPREDMPGFEACDGYRHTQAKREAWLKIEAETRRALSRGASASTIDTDR